MRISRSAAGSAIAPGTSRGQWIPCFRGTGANRRTASVFRIPFRPEVR